MDERSYTDLFRKKQLMETENREIKNENKRLKDFVSKEKEHKEYLRKYGQQAILDSLESDIMKIKIENERISVENDGLRKKMRMSDDMLKVTDNL